MLPPEKPAGSLGNHGSFDLAEIRMSKLTVYLARLIGLFALLVGAACFWPRAILPLTSSSPPSQAAGGRHPRYRGGCGTPSA